MTALLIASQVGCSAPLKIGAYSNEDSEHNFGCESYYRDSHYLGVPHVVSGDSDHFVLWFENWQVSFVPKADCIVDGSHFSCVGTEYHAEDLFVGTIHNFDSFSLLWTSHDTDDFSDDQTDKTVSCTDGQFEELNWDSDLPVYW